MFKFFSLAFVSLFSTLAFAQTMTCRNYAALTEVDDKGVAHFEQTDTTVVVELAAGSADQYVATISGQGKSYTEADVKVGFHALRDLHGIEGVLEVLAPSVDPASVAKVRVANVGTKANAQDGGGIQIIEYWDANNLVLANVAQVGWSWGKCSN